MSFGPKTIAVFLDDSASGRKRVTHAAALAQRWGAHLVGVNVVFAGVALPASMSFARGGPAFKQVATYRRQLDSDAEDSAIEVDAHFRAVCTQLGVSGKLHQIGRVNTTEEAIHCAFHSDLVIVGHPEAAWTAGRAVGRKAPPGERRADSHRAKCLGRRDDREQGTDRLERLTGGSTGRSRRHGLSRNSKVRDGVVYTSGRRA